MSNGITINNYDTHLAIYPTDNSNRIDHIPAMVYRPTLTPKGELILIKDRARFNTPTVKYGKHNLHLQEITSTYDTSCRNHGVILMGLPGSGKSLLAEELGNWFIKRDIPVLMITEEIPHQLITLAIRAMGPCMVYIDEIGKLYDVEMDQPQMLPMFSSSDFEGVSFVVTGNDRGEFNRYLLNRPQRFKYMIQYNERLDPYTVKDILEKKQVAKELHAALTLYAAEDHAVSFDVFLSVVDMTAGITSVDELHEKLNILNVPAFPYMAWDMVSRRITFAEEPEAKCDMYFRIDGTYDDLRDLHIKVGHIGIPIHSLDYADCTIDYFPEHQAIRIRGEVAGFSVDVHCVYGPSHQGFRPGPIDRTARPTWEDKLNLEPVEDPALTQYQPEGKIPGHGVSGMFGTTAFSDRGLALDRYPSLHRSNAPSDFHSRQSRY